MASTMNAKKKSNIPISKKSFWAFAVNWSEILLVLLVKVDDFFGFCCSKGLFLLLIIDRRNYAFLSLIQVFTEIPLYLVQ